MDVRPAIKILSPRADSILMLRPTLTYVRSKSRLPKSTRNEPNLDRVASGLSACLPGCMRRGYGYAMQAGARERPMRSERSFANIARNFQSQLLGRRARPVAISSPNQPSASVRVRGGLSFRSASLPPINHNFSVSAIIFAAPWDVTQATDGADRRRNEGVAGLVCSSFAACDAVIPRGNHTSHGVQDRSIYGRSKSFVHPF